MPNKITNLLHTDFEFFAMWGFILGTSLSALGPVFHDTGWGLSLIALLYVKIRYGANLITLPAKSKYPILPILIIAFVWSMVANCFASNSFESWGQSASIPLEMLLTIFFVTRIMYKEEKLNHFTITIIVGAVIANFFFIFITPITRGIHQNLVSGNALGIYNILVMPFFFCYAFWRIKERPFLSMSLCIINTLSLFSNFSSGPWLAGFIQALIIAFYALKDKKITIGFIAKTFAFLLIMLLSCNIATDNFIFDRLRGEAHQAQSIKDIKTFTTQRAEIWYVAVKIIEDYPLTGVGRAMFKMISPNYIDSIPQEFRSSDQKWFNQPHNMYLGFMVDAGIPSLILFMLAFYFSIAKSLSIIRAQRVTENNLPWGVICFAVFIGQLVHGIGCDVFEVRSDMAPVFWAIWGILIILPDGESRNRLTIAKK